MKIHKSRNLISDPRIKVMQIVVKEKRIDFVDQTVVAFPLRSFLAKLFPFFFVGGVSGFEVSSTKEFMGTKRERLDLERNLLLKKVPFVLAF